jgi:uncharacterized protein involved in type VI secretion and phage assembly
MPAKFFGKYRGVVVNNVDPEGMGRVKVQVPDVFGTKGSGFALPCVPCNLPKTAGSALPKTGATVWVEFEQGDANRPIWTGCFYGNAAVTPPALRNK